MSGNPNGEAGKATGRAAPGDRHSPIPPSAQHSVPVLAFKGPPGLSSEKGVNGDPLYLIQRDLFLAAVVEHGGAGRFVVGDVLGRFQGAVVLEVSGDAGGAEGVVADAGLDAGGFGALR